MSAQEPDLFSENEMGAYANVQIIESAPEFSPPRIEPPKEDKEMEENDEKEKELSSSSEDDESSSSGSNGSDEDESVDPNQTPLKLPQRLTDKFGIDSTMAKSIQQSIA